MMTRRQLLLAAIGAALLSFPSGCVVAERHGRNWDTYYYYPDVETYYSPRDHNYYWYDRDRRDWRHDERPPRDFYKERGWVRLESEDEPYKRHEEVKRAHPPGRYDGRDDRDRDRDNR
ncbi:MAG TPA: hypothetical protein VGA09_09150 [Candidatus Binatia bacterium]